MYKLSNQRLTMSFVVPASMLCKPAYNQQPNRNTCMMVEQYRDNLCISVRGDWSSEMLLNGLYKVLREGRVSSGVEIDLMDMKEVDQPKLRSLVAALTVVVDKFRCIWVSGLQPEFQSHLHRILSQGLDGGTWKSEIAPESIGFTRQRRTKTVQGRTTSTVTNLTGNKPMPGDKPTRSAMQAQGPG